MSSFIIRGGNRISGNVRPSGNKNEALPVLMASLLANSPVTLKRCPKIKDVLTTCDILEHLGMKVTWSDEETVELDPRDLSYKMPPKELCAKIRASILLLGPMLARFGKIELPLPGGDVIGARRIDTHWDGAIAFGAELNLGHSITGDCHQLKACEFFLDEPSVTATENLIMLAVLADGVSTLHNVACEPHVVGLCKFLEMLGAEIQGVGSNRLIIHGKKSLGGGVHEIGPDFMEVGSFLCLGALGGGEATIQDVCQEDFRFIDQKFNKIGIKPNYEGKDVKIDGSQSMQVAPDLGGKIPTIYSSPWPAFPTDLMSVSIVAATQSKGTIIFFEKMFEGRMFFTDKLIAMGANIVLCDPHRIVVNGPAQLYGQQLSSPDVRAGMSLLIAASIAEGESRIDNIYQIERGYYNIDKKLRGLGVDIERTE